jgi:hypothetical protein
MRGEQANGEGPGKEGRFGDKAPVDGPLVEELASQFKGPGEVGWCSLAEGVAICNLSDISPMPFHLLLWMLETYRDLQDDHSLRDRLRGPQRLQKEDSHRRQRQQQAHLNIQPRRIEEAAPMPVPPLIAVNRREQPQHRKTIIKASQHKDTVHPLRQDQQRKYIRRDLSLH